MNSSTFNDAEYLNHQVKFENDENTDMHGTNETMSEQKIIRVLKMVWHTNSNSYVLYCIFIGQLIWITLDID